jgi:hypothetical protein
MIAADARGQTDSRHGSGTRRSIGGHPRTEGGVVFTTIRQYRCNPGDARDIAHQADAHFADRLAQMEGFIAYELIDCGSGDLFTTTVFTDRAASMGSNELAAQFIEEHLAGFQIERVGAFTGAVLVNRAESDVLELVHA